MDKKGDRRRAFLRAWYLFQVLLFERPSAGPKKTVNLGSAAHAKSTIAVIKLWSAISASTDANKRQKLFKFFSLRRNFAVKMFRFLIFSANIALAPKHRHLVPLKCTARDFFGQLMCATNRWQAQTWIRCISNSQQHLYFIEFHCSNYEYDTQTALKADTCASASGRFETSHGMSSCSRHFVRNSDKAYQVCS